jgi:isoleucyl-tRNA synthetase
VRLSVNPELYPFLKQYARDLPALFIVSQVALDRADTLSVHVERAAGRKCERCWKYTTDTGVDARFPTICGPCAEAVVEICHDRH